LMRARALQRGLLPQEQLSLETLDYAGHCIQAKMIGRHYYDFLVGVPRRFQVGRNPLVIEVTFPGFQGTNAASRS